MRFNKLNEVEKAILLSLAENGRIDYHELQKEVAKKLDCYKVEEITIFNFKVCVEKIPQSVKIRIGKRLRRLEKLGFVRIKYTWDEKIEKIKLSRKGVRLISEFSESSLQCPSMHS
ncbi:hypothetical protein DRP05_13450 [Archaeoglobales archaeon]|nr:MAG: hypothetical protein DRP05_13450 [Archaeoglobales archaeon]